MEPGDLRLDPDVPREEDRTERGVPLRLPIPARRREEEAGEADPPKGEGERAGLGEDEETPREELLRACTPANEDSVLITEALLFPVTRPVEVVNNEGAPFTRRWREEDEWWALDIIPPFRRPGTADLRNGSTTRLEGLWGPGVVVCREGSVPVLLGG